jgi:hypothetical protein
VVPTASPATCLHVAGRQRQQNARRRQDQGKSSHKSEKHGNLPSGARKPQKNRFELLPAVPRASRFLSITACAARDTAPRKALPFQSISTLAQPHGKSKHFPHLLIAASRPFYSPAAGLLLLAGATDTNPNR